MPELNSHDNIKEENAEIEIKEQHEGPNENKEKDDFESSSQHHHPKEIHSEHENQAEDVEKHIEDGQE